MLKFVLLWVSVVACSGQEFDPYSVGPHSTVRADINATSFPNLPTNLDVWSPREPGSYPVVYFLDSFGAITPGQYYDLTMDRVASHGVVVVLIWKIASGLEPIEKLPAFQQTMDWCEENMDQMLVEAGADPGIQVDHDMTFALGHSAGAHILCDYLKTTCGNFKGLALLSPVDGVDPWGIIDTFCTTTGETLNFVLPTLIMPAGLDDVSGGLGEATCAPAEMSNRRFYDALDPASPRWFINATDWGHVDFMDPGFQEVVSQSHFCAVNEAAGVVEFSTYRSFVAGQIVSFVAGLRAVDCSTYLAYLEEPVLMPVTVAAEHEQTGPACPTASCSWTPLL